MTTAIYYHGTSAKLTPGDILLPGSVLGKTNFGRSEHVYMLETTPGTEHQALTMELARQWACYAADRQECVHGDGCSLVQQNMTHEDAECQGVLWDADCVFVYRVEPIGELSRDDANDLNDDERAFRSQSARVLEQVIVDW